MQPDGDRPGEGPGGNDGDGRGTVNLDADDRGRRDDGVRVDRRGMLKSVAAAGALFGVGTGTASERASATSGTVLILGSTVSGGTGSDEADKARALGYDVDVVNDSEWRSMTTEEFESYRAVILGDPDCSQDIGRVDAAEDTVETWSPAITGNVLVLGGDASLHYPGQSRIGPVIEDGIAFAASDPDHTGAYITTSCYYNSADPGTPVPVLDGFGEFTATRVPGCFDDIAVVAEHPQLTGYTDHNLSGWGCSVHNAFGNWPLDFEVMSVALDGSAYTAPDGTVGTPWILARGVQVTSDIDLVPTRADLTVGQSHTLTASVERGGDPVANTDVTFEVLEGPHEGTTGTVESDGSGTATFTYEGAAEGEDVVEATFVDEEGVTQRSSRVTATWELPDIVAEAGGPYSVPEGGSVTLDGSAPVGRSGLSFEWDLDGDGAFEASGRTPTFDAAGMDGPAERSVTLQVSDPTGASNTDTATVTVGNVAPSVTIEDAPDVVNIGETATLDLTFGDPGADDLSATVAWGDGQSEGIELGGDRGSVSVTHTYEGSGEMEVSVSVGDGDGASDAATAPITVNAPPEPDLGVDPAGTEPVAGSSVTLDGAGSDNPDGSGGDLTYEWDVDGDGETEDTGPTLETNFEEAGWKTVTMTVTDEHDATESIEREIPVGHEVEIEVSPDRPVDLVDCSGTADGGPPTAGAGRAPDEAPSNGLGGVPSDPGAGAAERGRGPGGPGRGGPGPGGAPTTSGTDNCDVPVVVQSTDGFDPLADLAVGTLRFGTPDLVEGGGGARAVHEEGHAASTTSFAGSVGNLLVHFPAEDTGLTTDHGTAKLVGRTEEDLPVVGTVELDH